MFYVPAHMIARATGFRPARSGADSATQAEGKKDGGRGGDFRGQRPRCAFGAGPWQPGGRSRAGGRRARAKPSRARRSLQEGRSRREDPHAGRSRAGVRRVQGGSVHVPGASVRTLEGKSGRNSAVKGIPGQGFGLDSRPRGRSWRFGWPVAAQRSSAGSFWPASPRSGRPFSAGDPRPVVVVITVPRRSAPAPGRRSSLPVATLSARPPHLP
ncbi:hypothetical protein ES708_28535 [subsurface metagenome]